jgi:hypothetical protein
MIHLPHRQGLNVLLTESCGIPPCARASSSSALPTHYRSSYKGAITTIRIPVLRQSHSRSLIIALSLSGWISLSRKGNRGRICCAPNLDFRLGAAKIMTGEVGAETYPWTVAAFWFPAVGQKLSPTEPKPGPQAKIVGRGIKEWRLSV